MSVSLLPKLEPFVDVTEAAKHLGVPVSWLYRRGDLEGLPCYRIGKHRRYKLTELDDWVCTAGVR